MSAAEPEGREKRALRRGVLYVDAGPGDAGQRVDNFLLRVLKTVPRSRVYRLLRRGEVRINGRRARPEQRLAEGDRIRLPPVETRERAKPLRPGIPMESVLRRRILHEDRDLLVLDKPCGLAVHGGSGVTFGVIEALRAMRPDCPELELVHRLDRDTSGCLLIAKRRAMLRALHASLRERTIDKRYLALVCGRWRLGPKRIDLPLRTNVKRGGERVVKVHVAGQQSESWFAPIEHFGGQATLLEIRIGTGRTHQIRVHAAHAGHPVAGDPKYGDRDCNQLMRELGLRRMFLHAHSLEFERPDGSGTLRIEAPLDHTLTAVLERLRARASDNRVAARPGRE